MQVIGLIGASFEEYGTGKEDGGWVEGSWKPSPVACNPHGMVQAGVHAVILDAAMNFAINAALSGRDRTDATLEMKAETMRPAHAGDDLRFRGHVMRMARRVAYGEAQVRDLRGRIMSRATGTFLLHRA